jgi:hypothetical protein
MSDRRASWLITAFLLLLANTAYLVSSATPSLFHFANVALHPLLGMVLAAGFAAYLFAVRRRQATLLMLGALVSFAGVAFGLAVFQLGATRPHRWLLEWHIVFSVLGALPLLVVLLRSAGGAAGFRHQRHRRSARQEGRNPRHASRPQRLAAAQAAGP